MKPLAARASRASLDGFERRGTRSLNSEHHSNEVGNFQPALLGRFQPALTPRRTPAFRLRCQLAGAEYAARYYATGPAGG